MRQIFTPMAKFFSLMEREAVSCHLDMETSSLFVATTAAAADCILPTNHEVMASAILRR